MIPWTGDFYPFVGLQPLIGYSYEEENLSTAPNPILFSCESVSTWLGGFLR